MCAARDATTAERAICASVSRLSGSRWRWVVWLVWSCTPVGDTSTSAVAVYDGGVLLSSTPPPQRPASRNPATVMRRRSSIEPNSANSRPVAGRGTEDAGWLIEDLRGNSDLQDSVAQ